MASVVPSQCFLLRRMREPIRERLQKVHESRAIQLSSRCGDVFSFAQD